MARAAYLVCCETSPFYCIVIANFVIHHKICEWNIGIGLSLDFDLNVKIIIDTLGFPTVGQQSLYFCSVCDVRRWHTVARLLCMQQTDTPRITR